MSPTYCTRLERTGSADDGSALDILINSGRLSAFDQSIASVHLYPFVALIEKRADALVLAAGKRGSQWALWSC